MILNPEPESKERQDQIQRNNKQLEFMFLMQQESKEKAVGRPCDNTREGQWGLCSACDN